MKFLTVIGARPQFIKAAPVSRELRKKHEEIYIHTGQHYDPNMSDIFFEELNIPKPDYHLNIGSSSHGQQTGDMLKGIEEILLSESPDYVLVYGDTNSTIAGALAAAKLHIPVVHVESGLRSFNKKMPEELNRIMTDHISDYLFCPTDTAVNNLSAENIKENVFNVGDVMFDAVLYNQDIATEKSSILEELNLEEKNYYLITVHRAENTDDENNIKNIIKVFSEIEDKKVWPIHPRTKNVIKNMGIDLNSVPNLLVIEPVGYLDILKLQKNARKIITDSGGIQKEAYFMQVPCITLRNETEWVETLEDSANILVGTDIQAILNAVHCDQKPSYKRLFGDGQASKKIVSYFD